MESPVEIRYAGVVIGRAQEVRSGDGDSSFFLVVREPMPVGSVLHLRTGDRETPARVVHNVESADAAATGVQVRLIGESEEVATEWIPPPAPVVEKARPAEEAIKTAMPVIEVAMPVAQPPAGVGVETRLQRDSNAASEQIEFGFPAASAQKDAPPTSIATAEPVATAGAETTATATAATDATAAPEGGAVSPAEEPDGVVQVAIESKAVEAPAEPAAPSEELVAASSAPTGEERVPAGDLPPARPIAGPSGRRKTKRRK